jgi:hypothetical protein
MEGRVGDRRYWMVPTPAPFTNFLPEMNAYVYAERLYELLLAPGVSVKMSESFREVARALITARTQRRRKEGKAARMKKKKVA